MNISHYILWTIWFSTFVFLIRVVKRSLKNNLSWIFVGTLILVITFFLASFDPQLAALIGGIVWTIFLLVPSLGFSRINQLVARQCYREARQILSYIYWLHPLDSSKKQLQILQALEAIKRGDLQKAIAIFNQGDRHSSNLNRYNRSLLYWATSDWSNYLLWSEREVTKSILIKEPFFLSHYLRALGETGDLNGLLKTIDSYQSHLEKYSNLDLNRSRLMALAFCGQVTQVKQLLNSFANFYSKSEQQFWLATAQMVAGKDELAREQLIILRSSDNFIISKAAEWRLSNQLAEPLKILDEQSKTILKKIITEVGQEARYKQPTFSKNKKAYITYLLIFTNLVFFGLEIAYGGSEDLESLYILGALVPENVRSGEWWRILNANFLHFGWLHLTTNMFGLYFLGRFVENTLGRIRYLIIFLLSGIMSMTAFAFLTLKLQESNLAIEIGEQRLNFQNGDEQQLLVGASAAIMGLVGAIAAISFRDWLEQRSKFTTKRLQLILLVIVLQFCFDFTTPQVSSLSHFLGLISGFILTSIYLIKPINKARFKIK